MALLAHISKEWNVLKAAPISFIVLLGLGLAGGFYVGVEFKSQEVEAVKARLDLKEDELDGYKKKLEQRLDDVEKRLSEMQISRLKSNLQMKPGHVEIYWNRASVPSMKYATELSDAFVASGWKVEAKASDDAINDMAVIETDNSQTSETISAALEDAELRYRLIGIVSGGETKRFILD